jgi:hypothetical protein
LVPQVYKSEKIDTDLATTLHATAERMKAKGAQLVVHLPWLYILERQRDLWTTFRERVIQKYEPEVPVVAADPAMLLRSDGRDFCDSPLHLSKDATVQRSEVLADALGSYVVHRPTAVGSLPDKVY